VAERARPLKVGLYIPNGDGYMSGSINRWPDVLAMATAAEEAGFDSVWVADHMIFRFEGDEETQGRWECWSLLAALAAVTRRVEIGPLVSCMSFRNPALLAKIAETVDEISGGRLILAVGAGWHEPEYTAYGFPYDHRASRFEEGFTVVDDLLRRGRSNFAGAYVEVNECEIRPRGPRPGGIPLWVGTNGERLLRLCARHADAWNTTWITDPDQVPPLRAAVDAACVEVGRDPATLARTACVFLDLPEREGRGFKAESAPPPPRSAAENAEVLRGYAREGIEHVMVWVDPNTPEGVRSFAAILADLDTS